MTWCVAVTQYPVLLSTKFGAKSSHVQNWYPWTRRLHCQRQSDEAPSDQLSEITPWLHDYK
jgi:hypothetical protein